MEIGFTGASRGITAAQRDGVRALLIAWRAEGAKRGHHGDCVGGDATFHALCLETGIAPVGHPPTNPKKRAFCEGFAAVWPQKPYLVRNRDIVDCAERMIACPSTQAEELRSGVWATTRYSRKTGTPVWILYPDGTTAPPQST